MGRQRPRQSHISVGHLSPHLDAERESPHTAHRLTTMRRIQFIELHEQTWFPAFLRNDITDTLQCALNLSRAYASVVPLLQRALISTGNRSIVDLCSGGGGPWVDLSGKLKGEADAFRVALTDKYPNHAAFEIAQARCEIPITFCERSVDARNVPCELDGFRTLFTSFHHFPPHEASAIIQNSVDAGEGIGIFEITSRTAPAILLIFLWALAPFFLAPFVRPFRWSRLLCTYFVPIIPLVLLFDGVVSCLRTYRPGELREVVGKLSAAGYQWQAGKCRDSRLKMPITYLIGIPCKP